MYVIASRCLICFVCTYSLEYTLYYDSVGARGPGNNPRLSEHRQGTRTLQNEQNRNRCQQHRLRVRYWREIRTRPTSTRLRGWVDLNIPNPTTSCYVLASMYVRNSFVIYERTRVHCLIYTVRVCVYHGTSVLHGLCTTSSLTTSLRVVVLCSHLFLV